MSRKGRGGGTEKISAEVNGKFVFLPIVFQAKMWYTDKLRPRRPGFGVMGANGAASGWIFMRFTR